MNDNQNFRLSDDDVWGLVTTIASVNGLSCRAVFFGNDEEDPMPALAAELGISEKKIEQSVLRFAGVIKNQLLVFFSGRDTHEIEVLIDALNVLKVPARRTWVNEPVDSEKDTRHWHFDSAAFKRIETATYQRKVLPFLREADGRNRQSPTNRSPAPALSATVRNFADELSELHNEIRALYEADNIPWIIGYSGGKDSTAVVQLVWHALQTLPEAKRKKTIHIISTDTLVENPVVAQWVEKSLIKIDACARDAGMPFKAHRLTPDVENTFWVNLIGKGYPAPRHKFRWCTERMKISPSNTFINSVVKGSGEAILLLGTRKQESQRRERAMRQHERHRVRDRLSPNASLPGTLVYTPLESWSNDEVWMFLMQYPNPWGYNNKDLLTMYQGASADGECPLVVDSTTPSCGDSRFGCWVCTLVDQDKSMSAMVQNDDEKDWMLPLLKFRNRYLDFRPADGSRTEQTDRDRRDFRRMNGSITIYNGRAVHGPYTQQAREELLLELLRTQEAVRKLGAERGVSHAKNIELITLHELEEIRRIWITEKHEIEDPLPSIYQRATGRAYPGKVLDENLMFGREEMAILQDVCAGDRIHYELARELLDVERRFRTMSRRAGLFGAIDDAIRRGYFENEADATKRALEHASAKENIRRRFATTGGANAEQNVE